MNIILLKYNFYSNQHYHVCKTIENQPNFNKYKDDDKKLIFKMNN